MIRKARAATRLVGLVVVLVSALTGTLGVMALSVVTSDAARADLYTFDRGHTNITFSWDHVGLSRPSGRILGYEGTLEFDPENPEASRLDVTLAVASLWTGVAALDRSLKSADFLDAQTYPTITFKSTNVRRTGAKTGEVTGDLTIMDQTRPVTLGVTWNFTGEHPLGAINLDYKDTIASGFSATARVQRSEFGIKRGIPLVSDEIRISIESELIRK